jgi:hypothetical protein
VGESRKNLEAKFWMSRECFESGREEPVARARRLKFDPNFGAAKHQIFRPHMVHQ